MAFYDASSRYTLSPSDAYAERVAKSNPNYRLYTVKLGDTLESIALSALGDTRRYWEIADINPQIKFPLDLVIGDPIRMPL